MPARLRPLAAAAAFAASFAAVALSCGDSPTGPGRLRPRTVSVNEVVTGVVSPTDTARYFVRVAEGAEISVLLRVTSGAVVLSVWDSAGTRVLGPAILGQPDGEPLGWNATYPVKASVASTYQVRVVGQGAYELEVYAPDRAPERVSPAIAVGDTIVGEDLQATTDVDAFTFHGTQGDELVAYLQAGTGSKQGRMGLAVNLGGYQVFTASGAGDTSLERQTTGRFTVPADGDYGVVVTSVVAGIDPGYVGPYRFQLRHVDRRPEHAAAAAVVNDTTKDEALDYVGDVDEFTISGAPGDLYDVFFRVASGDTLASMLLEVPDGVGGSPSEPIAVNSTGRDSSLADHATGRFALPASGRATVRVSAGLSRGAYEMYVYHVDPAPESAPATLTFGDSVLTERIDAPGDVDEFTVTVPTGAKASLVLRPDPADVARLGGNALVAATLTPRGATEPIASTASYPSYHVDVPAGQYTLRVAGTSRYLNFYGGYHVFLYALSDAPEGRTTAAVAPGDTVVEKLDPVGDVDVYTLDGVQGDDLDFAIQATGAGAVGGFFLSVLAPPNAQGVSFSIAGAYAAAASQPLDAQPSGRVTLPVTGRYQIVVAGINGIETGPYRFVLARLDRAPETHAATIALGDTIADERLDALADVDEFTLRGAPGTEAVAYLTSSASTSGLWIEVRDPQTRAVLASAQSAWSETNWTERFTLPASGELTVRVAERRGANDFPYTLTGAYRFVVSAVPPIDPAPEHVAAAIAVDDTVSGEAVDTDADVDEFTFVGTAGQRVVLYFQTPYGVSWYDGLTAELVVGPTGEVLGSVTSINPTPDLESLGTAPITLPLDGQYVVRVRDANGTRGTGAFRFTVRALP